MPAPFDRDWRQLPLGPAEPNFALLGKDAIIWHAGDRRRLNIGGQIVSGTEGSPLTKSTSKGLGAAWTRTGSAGVNFGVRQPLNTFAAVTFMLFAAPVSIAQIKATLGQRQVGSSYQFELLVNCSDSFIATAGAMTLVSFNGAHGDTYIANAGIDGLPHCWVISNTSSSSAYAYRDGLPLTITRNAPIVSCIDVFQEYCIGNIGAYTTDGTYANDDPMMIAIAWPRQIPAALAKQLSENPLLSFRRRRQPVFGGFAAGGGTSVITLTATTTSAASILKAAKAQRQASTTAAAAIAKAAVSSKAAAVTSSATLARSAKLIRSATAVASAAVSKLAAAMRSATTTGSATLGTIKAKLLTLTASVTNSATVRRAIGATRVATTTAAGTLARAISTTKAALTTASGTIGKVVATTKAAATASMATVATVKAKLLTLAASLSVSGAITKTIKITRSGAVSLLALLERLFISGGGGPAEIFAALTSKRSERNSDTSARPKAQAQRRPKQ